ncbi:DUF461 domain-containing protein [Streptacidiphilus cavernicola]|uniref:DUF461 domain-containing protein n=1 Tax=Streptacidiphilus cavernicola TaxID=3342716 RepID=A0ABV6W261_9ACTN
MSRSLRRGAVAAVIIATAPILAACAAGDSAASLKVKPDNAATSIATGDSSLKLNGIVVVTGATGQAPANVTVNIANGGTQPDTLTGVTVNGVPATLTGDMTVQPQGSLLLGGRGKPSATVPTLDASPGQNTTVAFTFSSAGSVAVQALIATGTGEYATFAPVPPPAPTLPPVVLPITPTTAKATATATATGTKKP